MTHYLKKIIILFIKLLLIFCEFKNLIKIHLLYSMGIGDWGLGTLQQKSMTR